MTQILEVFADTGEVVERDRTPAEQAQYETDQAAAVVAAQVSADADAARVAARESAMVKLTKLGLNDSEVAAMMGGV